MHNAHRCLVWIVLSSVLGLALMTGLIPGDIACCSGWMPMHGPDCCSGHDARSKRCCEGETGLDKPNPGPPASVVPAAVAVRAPVVPAVLLADGAQARAGPRLASGPIPLYTLHASLLL